MVMEFFESELDEVLDKQFKMIIVRITMKQREHKFLHKFKKNGNN